MRYVKALVVIILFVFGLLFFIQNSQLFIGTVTLEFHIMDWGGRSSPMPLYLILLIAFLAGALISFLYLLGDKLKMHRELKRKNSRISSLEQELSSLRNMSLEDRKEQQV